MANKTAGRASRKKRLAKNIKDQVKASLSKARGIQARNRDARENINANTGDNAGDNAGDNSDINANADFIGDNADMNVNNGDGHTGHINANTGDNNDINANYTGDCDSVNNIGDNIDGDNFERADPCPSGSRFHARNVISDPIDKVASSSVPPCPVPEGTLSMESEITFCA